MRWSYFILSPLLCVIACGSAPKNSAPATPSSDWTQGPARALNGTELVYIGIGDDRTAENARFKAESFAFQNLANDCSLIPKSTRIDDAHVDQMLGILHQSFVRVRVGVSECEAAKKTLAAPEIQSMAQIAYTTETNRYRKLYDPPEPQEAAPLDALEVIPNAPRLFVVRQQIALAKERGVLATPGSLPGSAVSETSRAVAAFERQHPEIPAGTRAFSDARPNWVNHQPLAVRDSVEERAKLLQDYPPEPTPPPSHSKGKGRGTKGGRHGRPPLSNSNGSLPDPVPNP